MVHGKNAYGLYQGPEAAASIVLVRISPFDANKRRADLVRLGWIVLPDLGEERSRWRSIRTTCGSTYYRSSGSRRGSMSTKTDSAVTDHTSADQILS